METGYSKWRKLDNAALAFPAVSGEDDTRVFRFYCQLKDKVDGEILQKALDETMEKYPLFQAVLRKGLFWYYLERRDIHAKAHEEKKPPCSKLYIPDKKSLLFDVSYYKNRINFEVFHSLTDGTGAMHFLQELVQDYLILAHPEQNLPRFLEDEEVTAKDREEDSFSQYYSADIPKNKEKKPAAVKLRGERLRSEDMHITELVLPVRETIAKARARGVSITVMVTAMLLCAIHEEIPRSGQNRPVTLMIPVNLRNYFPSQSMANFFGWIEVGYTFSDTTNFNDVLVHVKEEFERELVKERIAMRMNGYVRLEKNPVLRAVPLGIKLPFLHLGAKLGGRSITAVYSNVGIIRFPEEYRELIDRFGLFASANSMQVCSCSFGNDLVLGFTSRVPSASIERNFQRMLKEEEIPYREEENDFPGYGKGRQEGKQVFQIVSFLCIAAAVFCGMINFMTSQTLSWFWRTAAGILCTWMIMAVAYTKRRNILKNEMWQLVILTVISILWDVFTGWHRWSVEFVLPVCALAVLCSIPVIAKVCRLEKEEYLFYLVQAGMLGCVPMFLVWLGIVKFAYLSVICTGISFLVLAGLFIFRKKDTLGEFTKKLRM